MLSTIEKVLILKQFSIFQKIPGEELVQIARITKEISFGAGELLVMEGDIGDAAYLIIDGEVDVQIGGKNVAALSKYQPVGEMGSLIQSRDLRLSLLLEIYVH